MTRQTHETSPQAAGRAAARPFWNPYLAGVLLGVVLLATYLVGGRGLGATAGFAGLATWLASFVSPSNFGSSIVHAKYWNDGAPLLNWTLFLLLGALVGAAISGWQGQKGNLWLYDALDGMANFQARIPLWGISLALLENFWQILGVFYMPVTRDLFYAQAGQHAYCGDRVIAIPEPGEVSNESLLLTYSRFHNQYSSTFPGKIRNLGCTAAHICYVATGRAEAALLAHVSYQDLAAAGIILEAAGGEIRKMDGGKFHLNEYLDGSRIEEHLLAAPKGKHKSIRDYLRPIA